MNAPLLEVEGLRVEFDGPDGPVPILRDIGLAVASGELVGLVGESGCGKTTLGLALLGLLPGGMRRVAGRVSLLGRPIPALETAELRRRRGLDLVMIFQDAMISLSPVISIGDQMRDVLRRLRGRRSDDLELVRALERVGVSEPNRRLRQYVHELSGGQRQRVLIAMALLGRPSLIVADEPTSALDTSTEAQVVDLLVGAARQSDAAVLLITHNLALVAETCDRALVMYAGAIVEDAPVGALFAAPRHPYTRALLDSVVALETPRGSLEPIPGRVPLPGEAVDGCRFHPRCGLRIERCLAENPPLAAVTTGHAAACWRSEDLGGRPDDG